MFLLRSSSVYIGFEILPSMLRYAKLQAKGKGWKILELKEIPIHSTTDFFNLFPKEAVLVGAIPGKEVLTRAIDIPPTKDKDLNQAVEFQIEPTLPFSLDKCILQPIRLEKHSLGSLLTILAAKKDHIQHYLTTLEPYSIDPDIVTAPSFALATLSKLLKDAQETTLLMHMGEKEGTCVLVEKGKPLTARTFNLEKNDIQKTVLSICSTYKDKKCDSLVLFCEEEAVAEMVQEVTGKKVIYPIIESFDLPTSDMQRYGLCIGIALSGAEKEYVNFRQKELKFKNPLKRLKKPLFAYFTLAFLLTISFFAMEKWILETEKKGLIANFSSLQIEAGNGSETPTNLKEIHYKLAAIQKEIESKPDTFPLLPLVPKVSDVLAWLSTHPKVKCENSADQIQFETVHYSLVKRPEFGKRNEHYLVKVELEFSTDNSQLARAFHDALIEPNAFINPHLEVQWNTSKGKYRTSFYLKDKTRYPQ